jgi:hypothetical protein
MWFSTRFKNLGSDWPAKTLASAGLLTGLLFWWGLSMSGTVFANQSTTSQSADWLALRYETLKPVGQGELRFLGLKIYEARLYAEQPTAGKRATELYRQPFALRLTYARGLKGRDIASRSAKEMVRLRGSELPRDWSAALEALFPNVSAGDEITGVYLPQQGARFYLNGGPIGSMQNPDLAQTFFDIWLSDRTPEPTLRAALLGL